MKKVLLAALSLLLLSTSSAQAGFFGFDSSRQESTTSSPSDDPTIFGDPSALARNPICTKEYLGGMPSSITNKALAAKAKAGCFDNFAILYSPLTKAPILSAEHLTRDNIVAASKLPRINSFHSESLLPEHDRAELKNFVHSGYDRGHMAPNKDMPTVRAQWQCFSLANMIAQNPNNNEVLWEGIESAVRTLTKKNGELYVITGPLFIGATINSLHGVLIPTHVFKAVYDPSSGRAAAYLAKNEEGMDYQVVSIDEINRLAGLNLFPSEVRQTVLDLPVPTPHRER